VGAEEVSNMKVTVEVDCTPQEARATLGLPDVTAMNEKLMSEMTSRMSSNIAALAPDELLKNWMTFGGIAQEHFRKLMTAAAGGKS
jgi:hypothetical protein